MQTQVDSVSILFVTCIWSGQLATRSNDEIAFDCDRSDWSQFSRAWAFLIEKASGEEPLRHSLFLAGAPATRAFGGGRSAAADGLHSRDRRRREIH